MGEPSPILSVILEELQETGVVGVGNNEDLSVSRQISILTSEKKEAYVGYFESYARRGQGEGPWWAIVAEEPWRAQ